MTFLQVVAAILGLGLLFGVPVFFIWVVVDHKKVRASERKGSGSQSAGVAGAMLELDRLLARPSAEHKIEAEQPVLKREDDKGGD